MRIALSFAVSVMCLFPLAAVAANVDEAAVKAAKTTADLKELGGVRLSSSAFQKQIVGKKLDEGGWTWTIRADGTAVSAADDKSWESVDAWSLKEDKYCREVKSKELCSEVWMVGPYMRMTDKGSKLSGWTVKVK